MNCILFLSVYSSQVLLFNLLLFTTIVRMRTSWYIELCRMQFNRPKRLYYDLCCTTLLYQEKYIVKNDSNSINNKNEDKDSKMHIYWW